MFELGIGEILLIVILILILFGPQKLPELAKAMGNAVHEFRKSASGENVSASRKESKPSKSKRSLAG